MESRKYRRISLEIPSQISIHEADHNKQTLTICDLSYGGAFVACEQPYEQHTLVNMSFELPSNQGTIEATGFVCWCGKSQYDGRFGMGIQFLVLSEEHQKRLKNFIENISKLL